MVNKSISEKIWILSWGIELQAAKYMVFFAWCNGVSTDAIQEQYYTGSKTVSSFYDNVEYSFLFIKITFLNQANYLSAEKCKIPMTEVGSVTILKTARPWPKPQGSISFESHCDLSVTGVCITRFFALKFSHCPTSPFLGQKIWYFQTRC